MIDKAVCNLLIPFAFESGEWDKVDDCKEEPSKKVIEQIKENDNYSCKEWFSYCFKNLPVNETLQMVGSPLLNGEDGTFVKRIEFNQPVRVLLGLHKNENRICSMKKENIDFRFGKIRLLFFKFGLGMIHLEVESENLAPEELLNFCEQLGSIRKDVKFTYENKVAKDSTVTIVGTIKKLIEKILSLQNYIQLSTYKRETFSKAYLQEYLVGSVDQNFKPQFFEMLRNQRRSNMKSAVGINSENSYKPFEYITWVIGERTLVCYSDMTKCGDDNRKFLTEPGGLVKSIDLNYITIYAYLIGLQLLLRDTELSKDQKLADVFSVLPNEKLSAEVHINELFDIYVSSYLWRLHDRIEKVCKDNQGGLDNKLTALSSQMNQMEENVSERLDYLVKQVDQLVSFTDTELKSFLEAERKKLREIGDIHPEEQVGEFINHTATYIDERIALSGDEIVKKEREGLKMLFGQRWEYLLPSSQTSLVSAGALLKRCADINTPDFDFSGICICATAALEAELKRVFFDGLLNYMVKNYGNPKTTDPEEIYKYWPDVLLTVPKFQYTRGTNSKIWKVKHFTMGNLPFLFGETGKLSDDPDIRKNQLEQAEMMKSRMSEYLSTIVLDYYISTPYEIFYLKNDGEDRFTCQPGCFVWKCERIRENYRNKAAHVNVMSEEEASSCYESIITKPDTYVYNAEITGVILELFCKIDGSKLNSSLYGKHKPASNTTVEAKKHSCPSE